MTGVQKNYSRDNDKSIDCLSSHFRTSNQASKLCAICSLPREQANTSHTPDRSHIKKEFHADRALAEIPGE